MADNSFSRDPVEQLIVDETGGSAPDARSGIDDLARKSRVPANFLMAFSEASGAPDDAGKVKVASAVAAKIAPRLAAGEKIEDIVKSVAGDEAEASAFIERAYQIADELYPAPARPKEDQPGVLGDMARSFGGSLVKGAGGMIEAAGIAAEEFADPVGAEFGQQPGPVRKGAKAAGDLVRGFGERIQEGMSDDAKAAIKDSMPDGDLFSPSTWTVGKNASLRGYAMLATDVLGSFAPVVATAILTKNPAVAAGVGGLQGAGAAAETGRSIVEEAARTIGPDGKSLLEAGSPYYREALASGKSPEEALALTVAATERMAALLTAPISAFGGAATGKIIGKGFESLATKGPLGRILGTAVASSLEEGIQEAAETIATRYGTKSASGLDISLTEGTFGDFLLGALGGSLPGAVAGGFHGGGKDDQEEAPARPRAQPTPPLAEPTQWIDETPPPVAGNHTSPSPVTPPAPAAPGAVIDPMADYLGKLTKFAAATKGAAIPVGSPASSQFDSLIAGARRHGATEEEIDDALRRGTQPQPPRPTRDIAATLPEPVFGKEVMGADVTVETGGMTPFIGKIIRDNGNTITIRDAEGDEIEVAHVQIERGEVILSAADAATPSIPAPQGSATNATGALTPATPVDPGALTLSQQAMAKVTPPKLEDAAPITPEDAAKRMRFIESQAETSGWTESMRKMHADLRAIAQPAAPTTATPDMGEVAVTPAAGSTPAPAAGEQLPAGPVAPKALDGEIITPEDDRRLEAEAAAAVGIEMTDAPVLTRAAWWDAADDDVRKAILDEAGPKAAAEYRRAMTFQKSSEDARRAISEAYGRLYLAGKIRNDGSIEAPKPVLAGPAQDAAKPIAQDAPAPGAAPEAAAKAPDTAGDKPKDKDKGDKPETEEEPKVTAKAAEAPAQPTPALSIAPIRERGAVLKGRPETEKPEVDGVLFTWDAKESGWIFARRHTDKVAQALGIGKAADPAQQDAPQQALPGLDIPTKAEVKAAVAEVDTAPTDGQKEAGNYQMGHIAWQGLDITVETPKGALRTGKDKDGETWSVKMPAHYGYIKRTTGADGDHVDVYLGDNLDSDVVVIIDQKDLATGAFDEHKVMLGFTNRKTALDFYVQGFSDGKGADRMAGHKVMTVAEFKAWLADGDTTAPVRAAQVPPAASSATDAKADAKKVETDRKKVRAKTELSLFVDAASSDAAISAAGEGTIAEFTTAIGPMLVKRIWAIAEEYSGDERAAVLELVADGKPVLPETFFENAHKAARKVWEQRQKDAARDPQVKADAIEAAISDAGISGETEVAQFTAGFDHALSGKSKSTLPQGGKHMDGYDAARAWIKTKDGKAWFDGKPRQAKEKSTGDALRRVWDKARAAISDLDASDMDKAWKAVLKGTQRADLLPNVLPEDATPGAKAWFDLFRSNLATFPEYYARVMIGNKHEPRRRYGNTAEYAFKGTSRSYRGLIADRFRAEGQPTSNSVTATDEQRLALTKEVADNYQAILQEVADLFAGARTLDDIAAVIAKTYGDPGAYGFPNDGPAHWLYADTARDIINIFPPKPGSWDEKYARWTALKKTEDAERAEGQRKDALIRPRLDRIERNTRDVRKGKSITAKELKRTFGFADVTIGEYVTAQEAEDHLNYAHDAFITLADMLGIKPEQIGFGGILHFTIGALGHGKMAAHFNLAHPDGKGGTVPVINVTKTRGDGTVLHEYFHAIDLLSTDPALKKAIAGVKKDLEETINSAETITEIAERFLTGRSSMTRMGRGATRKDHAIDGLRYYRLRPGAQTRFYREAKKLDGGNVKEPYWSNDKEPFARAAEAWGYDTLIAAQQRDDYLVSDWVAEGKVTGKTHRGTPYPDEAERARFVTLYKDLVGAMDWSSGRPRLKAGHPWHETPPHDDSAWKTAIDDAIRNIDQIESDMNARLAAEAAARAEADQKARDEALFGAQTDEVGPVQIEDAPLSEDDLSAIFDEESAAIREAAQEKPDAKEPGADIRTMEWTTDDAAHLLDLVEKGVIVLLADASIGLPTIHDIKGADHIGFGVFKISNAEYEGTFTAGGAMSATPSGKHYTTFSLSRGTAPFWDKDAAVAVLRRMAGLTEPQAKAPAAKPMPSLDAEADKTAGQLAAEFAKHGVSGLNESLAALTKLFGGGPNRLNSFPSGFDEDAYAAAKPHFTKAADEFRKAGLSFKDFVRVFFNALIRQFGDGVKPLAVRFAKEYQSSYEAIAPAETETAPVPVAADRTPEAMISDWVLARLREGEEISWQDLFKTADQSFGGSQAQGAYTPKDAYDAVELGVNRYLLDRKIGDPTVPLAEARNQIRRAEEVLALIPTQSKRTKEMDEFQQFSTPPHFAYLAAWAANMTGTDAFLEPSAGIGGLAVFAKIAGVQSVTVNELSARRLAVLRNLPFDAFYGENAEQLHNILPDQVKPTVIVMNPPFSATGGRIEGSRDTMNGARHIEQALKRLQPGGRLVAIVGQGMAADRPAFYAWWRKIRAEYNVRANIGLNGKTYAKYGTTFDTQVLVIDKSGPTAQDVVVGENLHPADALTLLESIRNDRPQATQPDQPLAGGTGRRPSGGEPETAAGAGVSGADLAADLGGGRIRADGQDNSTGTADAGMGAVDGDVRRPGRPGGIAQSGRSGDRGDAQPGGSADQEGSRSSGAGAADGSSGEVKVGTSAGAEQGTLTNSVFEPYRPKKVKIEGAVTHNTPLVESAALASVVPPDPTYTPNLPAAVVRKGLLSDAQLEAVVYAGQAHQQMLRDGSRRGFFLGDGTGVGKGRQISGIIMDNMRQGRKKAVWLSKKKELMADAQRDFADIGGDEKLIFSQANSKVGDKIMPKEGILFAGYATIRSQSKAAQTARKAAGGNRTAGEGGFLYERVKQIVDWVGKDFDGVLVFDEAHEMGNAVPVRGKRGVTKPSDQALAGLELQRALPKARVVYVSATGATEVQNLAYAQRLGLWGDGTAFSGGVMEFVNTMSRSVSAMELVAQNLKQMGLYLARSLAFDGVTYARLEHQLTDYQRDTYDLLASGWQTVLNNIDAALKDTGVLDEEGKNSGRNARSIKSAIMSQFWGAHQRFFNQIITASQMPSILDQIDADLAEGRAIVLQITNTNEADQERAIAKAKAGGGDEDGGDLEEMDLTPREMLIQFIDKSFPVNQHETYTDLDGNEFIRVVHDSEGRPVVNKEAEARREQLKDAIRAMRIPDAPLQMLVDRFGAEKIAEITGRKQRLVLDKDGKRKIEKRGNAAVQTDAQAFKDDKRRILVFSQAGGTGFSFHSDLRYKNKRQRAHYIVQAGWSADKAVQGFGRSHRTNQANAPIYRLVTTDIPAHKRFISSIARRLEQLGALTAGQRDTAGGSIFSATDNLESEYASAAVRMFFNSVTGAARPAEVPDDLLTQMGLAGIVDESGSLNENNIPPTTQFLNRLLSLRLDTQKVVFDIFLQTMDAQIEIARRLGTFDDGLKSIRHVGAKVLTEQEVFRDEATNAPVRYFHIEYKTPNQFYDFDALPKSRVDNATRSAGYFRNKKSGRVAAIVSTGMTSTNDRGQIEGPYAVIRTSGTTYVRHSEVHVDNFERIDEAEARKLWEEENTKRPPNLDHDLHLVVGGILPIWNRFTSPKVDVTRIALDDGRRLLGRAIAPQDLAETLNNLDAKSAAAQMGGAGILAQIAKNKSVKLSNGWRIKPVTVSNERRAEIELSRGAAFMSRQQQDLLRNAGVIVERISWQERFFLPIDKPETVDAVLAAVNANVVAAEEQDDAIKESRFLAGDAITASAREINAELAKVGIAGRVTARLVDRLIGKSGALVAGRYRTGRIAVSAQSGDPLGVTRHEIIHALRDRSLWGRGNGLFTDAEWEGLVREAKRHKDIRARVEAEYADADRDARNEEMVAELHRLWAAGEIEVGKTATGLLGRLRDFLTAVADVLRGRKVVDAADTLARIASGEIGRRGGQPRGPDGRFVAADADMRAFHGTPHEFDRFSLDHIGTGEGAQAYGWGLYFASRKGVAEWYRDKLRHDPIVSADDVMTLWHALSDEEILSEDDYVPGSARDDMEDGEKTWSDLAGILDGWGVDGDAAIEKAHELYSFDTPLPKSRLYEVEIPDDADLLDWDAPLSKQPQAVRTVLRDLLPDMFGAKGESLWTEQPETAMTRRAWVDQFGWQIVEQDGGFFSVISPSSKAAGGRNIADKRKLPDAMKTAEAARKHYATDLTGRDAYNMLSVQQGGDRAASEALRAAGIPGHRYLDGGSRADGDGSRNYVIYDDARVEIIDREMRPGLTGKGKGKTAADRLMRFWPGDKAGTTKAEFDRNERTFLGNVLTNAMDGKGGVNLLALVPGRALFAELGKNIPSARAYLRHKEEMDAMRNEWHARTDETAQAWRKLIARDGAANAAMMDLMHDATISGVDPSTRFKQRDDNFARKAFEFVSEHGDAAPDWARALVEGQERRRMAHGPLAERFAALPPEFRAMFTRVRDSYDNLATAIEDAVIANAEKGMKVNIERAELRYKDALDQIRDDGLTGEDKDKAEAEAKEKLDEAKRRAAFSKGARIAALRAKFESNRLDGPYFPLARFGNFFVTVRDKESGKVLSFSRFEKEQDQKRAAAEWRAEDAYDVQIGTLADAKALRQQVDPSFVADIEDILGDAAADEGVMDMVWQRWLETLPDMSIRRTRLHRKGTPGYDTDAFRAFGRQMFHGAHQLARMSFAMDMSRNLEDARREAAQTSDPNRNGLIVNEMERRHEFTMNPKGGAWAQIASSAAFLYYLAVTPAAAAVNLSQTTIVGVPVLAAGFDKGKISDAAAHILRASKDFLGGRFSVERAKTLTADEHAAMKEAYRRGTVDKSQAHDLAGVAETGVEYNDFRSRWMARFSFLFHHAERANREVTFLAAYRMAREHGMDHGNAIEKAADLTWKTHFDYQNTSRPRLMQNDAAKVLLTFKNFTVNLNWRLFRDAHQMIKGATREERREARTQLIGITAMMMLHAGITGTWGYTLITTLLGLFADDGDDDVEEALQSALVNTFGPQIAGILLKGVPGHLTGINLSERIGMPSLWFRESDRNLEGDDVYNYWLTEMVGVVPGIVENTLRGVQMAWDGDVQRGVETVMPKAIRDIMLAYRYASEGVTTLSGNPILDDTSIADSFKKALGFSPARISERYEANTRLRNAENRIEGERSDILSDAAREVMAGEPMSERVRRKIERFNRENPGYPIDGKTISRSVKARQRAVQEMEGGIRLNRRLNERLREEAAPPIYN